MTPESRLIEIRKTMQLNQTDFAASMGFGRSVIADIERGQTKVTIKILEAAMKKYSANVSWLLTGEGEMFLPSGEQETAKPSLGYLEEVFATKEELEESIDRLGTSSANAASSMASDLRAEIEEKVDRAGTSSANAASSMASDLRAEIEEKVDRLEESSANAVNSMASDLRAEIEEKVDRAGTSSANAASSMASDLRAEIEALKEVVYREHGIEDEREDEVREVEVSYLGRHTAAGKAFTPDNYESIVRIPETWLPADKTGLFTGKIEGTSMGDIIPDGSYVLLRHMQTPIPISGRVYVFTLNEENTIKKFWLSEYGPQFLFLDGSGRIITPRENEVWTCQAEFVSVIPADKIRF